MSAAGKPKLYFFALSSSCSPIMSHNNNNMSFKPSWAACKVVFPTTRTIEPNWTWLRTAFCTYRSSLGHVIVCRLLRSTHPQNLCFRLIIVLPATSKSKFSLCIRHSPFSDTFDPGSQKFWPVCMPVVVPIFPSEFRQASMSCVVWNSLHCCRAQYS